LDKILIGKPVAQAVYQNIASLIKDTASPRMAIIKIGDDPASEYYATNILKQCTKHGFDVFLNQLPSLSSEQVVISLIERLNHNNDIHGIIIQKPLPKHLNEDLINVSLNPSKDIDGIHPENLGKLFLALDGFCPCTALSVLEIIKYYNIETTGRHVVILGRSSVIAKPLAGILLHKGVYGNATVTICHSYTKNLKTITNSADILVAAIGVPGFVTADFIKENAICIDA
jgi:methylenetetrahydrofolate dehydrogenase (NADP+)/methenyltetrahydrofolate cyclohydrolase